MAEFGLQAAGTWEADADGDLTVDLDIDIEGASLTGEGTEIGDVTVTFSGVQDSTATGNFDPSTGVGGFDTDLTLTIETIDFGEGAQPIEQPCDIALSLSLTGSITLGNGWLTASDPDPG